MPRAMSTHAIANEFCIFTRSSNAAGTSYAQTGDELEDGVDAVNGHSMRDAAVEPAESLRSILEGKLEVIERQLKSAEQTTVRPL